MYFRWTEKTNLLYVPPVLKVGAFLKFLQDLNPQISPARLALFNWLRSFADHEEPLTRELIEQFFCDALDYPHWVGNSNQLSKEIKYLINQFNSYYTQKLELSDLRFPEDMQIIEIERPHDVASVLSCHLGQTLGPDDKYRLLPEANKRFVAVILCQDRSIEVRSYDRKFTLRGGILEPLRKSLATYYTPNLELSENHEQHLEIAPYITARFTVSDGKIKGCALRGFVFQKMIEMNGEQNLKDEPRVYLPLRRLEQFFIDRRSDKDYRDLIQKLERTRSLVQAGDPEAMRWGSSILAHAETALENIYAGDQFLTLQISYLRHSLPSKGTAECPTLLPIDESDLTN